MKLETAPKALLEGHHVPSGERCPPQALMALPVSLTEDLKLLDAEVRTRTRELISAMNDSQLSDLALTFSVAATDLKRRPRHQFEGRWLRGGHGGQREGICETSPATADLGGQQTSSDRCSGKGLPRRLASCVFTALGVARGITRSAGNGVEALAIFKNGGARRSCGIFKDTRHQVVEWFWSYVPTLSHAAKKAELLGGPRGHARCPPFWPRRNLHGREMAC